MTNDSGLDAVVITAVSKTPFNQAIDVVKAGARVVAVGLPVDKMDLDIPRLVLDGIQVVGSLVGTREDLKEAFQFAADGKVVPKVTKRPIEDVNDIFEEMEQGKVTGESRSKAAVSFPAALRLGSKIDNHAAGHFTLLHFFKNIIHIFNRALCHFRYNFTDVNDIFEEMEQGKVTGRMVIDFTS